MGSVSTKKQLIDKLPKIAHSPKDMEILYEASRFRERLLHEIKHAKQRIYLVALYLQDDEAGQSILDALYGAKQQNPTLDIKVFVDWHRAQRGLIGDKKSEGNATLYKKYAQQYSHAIEILGVPVRNKEIFGVLHLKGFIFDDTVLYSGASINNIYLAQKQNYRFDRYHVLHNKQLADSMAAYINEAMYAADAVTSLTTANRATTKSLKPAIRDLRAKLQHSQYQFLARSINDNQVGLTPLVGLGKRNNTLNKYICELIASAETQLTICTPYFNPPRSVMLEIKRALRRGVQIDIIVGDKTANDFYIDPSEPFKTIGTVPYLYEMNLRRFAKRYEAFMAKRQLKLHLWCHERNSFHLKGIWVDGTHFMLTGSNLNPRAWKLDLENAILVHDKHQLLADEFNKELSNIMEHTELVGSYKQIERFDSYPPAVLKLLKRIKRLKADHLLNQIL